MIFVNTLRLLHILNILQSSLLRVVKLNSSLFIETGMTELAYTTITLFNNNKSNFLLEYNIKVEEKHLKHESDFFKKREKKKVMQ